jgi:hypothetical protein
MTREDLKNIIDKLKTEAVGRCRERLESAAQKARAMVKREQYGSEKEKSKFSEKEHGVTMVLKRKYGL